ncbi:MAG: carboxypeptidase regulatory-like domain-containing protein [Planctomycetes bacterium]|nr:carboxypeptidase regulatory-like domain-containing protein [Planctomycetota bacterium]
MLDPSGKPLANVPVLVIGGGHSGERPLTNAAGEFQVAGLPPTFDGYVAVHVSGYAALVREPVKIAERTPDSVTLRLVPEQVVEGVVTDPDGNALANAKVEVRGERRLRTPIRKGASWEEVLQIDTVRTDTDGRFRFTGLNPGEVELLAHWPRALEAVGAAKVEAGDHAARVRIDPKEHDQVLFAGRVLDAATHAPIAGVEVSADSAAEGDAPPLSQRATTDATGTFALGPFAPSLFHLEASHRFPGARRASTWKLAGARDPGLHRLEIELAPEPQ